MKRFYYSLLLTIVLSASTSIAQVFTLMNVNYANFPIVSAQFVAWDAVNNPYSNLTADDFRIVENNFLVPVQDVSVSCVEATTVPPVNVVLAIDQSNSMTEIAPDGLQRWKWVVEGATSFVNTVDFVNAPSSRIAVVSFGTYSYLRCNFSDNKQQINDSISKTKIGGGTSFNQVLLDDNIGAISLLASRIDNNRRIVVFLTDGQPQDATLTEEIISRMLASNIQFYAITIGTEMNNELYQISSRTGGKSYRANTLAEVRNIYSYIALDIQKKQTCSITWKSAYPCTNPELIKNTDVTFIRSGIVHELSYALPEDKLFKIKKSSNTAYFGNQSANGSSEADISITPESDDYSLSASQIRIDPNNFFSITDYDVGGSNKTPPLFLPKGVERRIRIKFTQGASVAYRQAILTLDGSPCPQKFDLVGGLSRVILVEPNTETIYSSCQPITIEWIGTESNSVVNLFYSEEGSSVWYPIATNLSGTNKYVWTNPPTNKKLKLSINRNSESGCFWVRSMGGIQNDVVTGLAFNHDTTAILSTGYFTKNVKVIDSVYSGYGLADFFIAEHNTDGELIWFRTSGSRLSDSSASIVTDTADNIFIAGSLCNGTQFGTMSISLPDISAQYCFVAKYLPSGNFNTVSVLGSKYYNQQFEAHGQRLRYDPATNKITLYGIYKGTYKDSKFYLPPTDYYRNFTAVFDINLSMEMLQQYSSGLPDISLSISDIAGNTYLAGNFVGSENHCGTTIVSAGGTDIYLKKTGVIPGSADTLSFYFQSRQPNLTLSTGKLDFGQRTTGALSDSTLRFAICNTDSLPVQIFSASISSATSGVFALATNLDGTTINPGECADIRINFTPSVVGIFTGILSIVGNCPQSKSYTLQLEGTAVCDIGTLASHSFTPTGVYESSSPKRLSLITNHNPDPVEILIQKSGDLSDFDISLTGNSFMLEPDSSLSADITFHPTSAGNKSINLAYQFNTGCQASTTVISGIGVATDITVSPIDFGKRRLLTEKKKMIYIRNNSTIDRTINTIDFATTTQNPFTFAAPVLPLTIKANSIDSLEVAFVPTEEIQYTNHVLLSVSGQSKPEESIIRGEGILPKIDVRIECSDPIKKGQKTTTRVYVSNPSTTADLHLEWMALASTTDYRFPAPPPLPDVIRAGKGNYFDIIFEPQTSGMISNSITITSDACAGPSENPLVSIEYPFSCEATSESIPSDFSFGGVLVCSESKLSGNIVNQSSSQVLTIDKASISGTDKEYFTVQTHLPLEVAAGESAILTIGFQPDANRDYSAILNLSSANSQIGTIKLTGTGKSLRFYFDIDTIRFYPNEKVTLNVFADIPAVREALTIIAAELEYNKNTLALIENSVRNTNLPNLVWSASVGNKPTIRATGSIPNGFNGLLFSADCSSYLGDSVSSFIGIRPLYDGCVSSITGSTNTKITGVCFSEGRFVEVSKIGFGLGAIPNPLRNNVAIGYRVPFDSDVEIDVYNSIGNRVKQLVHRYEKQGIGDVVLPAEELSSGVYLVRMTACGEVSSAIIVIDK